MVSEKKFKEKVFSDLKKFSSSEIMNIYRTIGNINGKKLELYATDMITLDCLCNDLTLSEQLLNANYSKVILRGKTIDIRSVINFKVYIKNKNAISYNSYDLFLREIDNIAKKYTAVYDLFNRDSKLIAKTFFIIIDAENEINRNYCPLYLKNNKICLFSALLNYSNVNDFPSSEVEDNIFQISGFEKNENTTWDEYSVEFNNFIDELSTRTIHY